MSALLAGDLSGLTLPEDLRELRHIVASVETPAELEPLYQALAAQHPTALLDLVIGPKAMATPAAVQAALGVAELLEQKTSPAALYKRLLELEKSTQAQVLAVAAQRNPAAGWLVPLSALAEECPGVTHLAACVSHPAFPAICWAHASAGHVAALVQASDTGRAEPAAALLAAGRADLAVLAASRALAVNPTCPVVAYLAATGGPHIEPLLVQLVPRLKSAAAGEALRSTLVPFPKATRLLTAVILGMR